MNHQKTPYPPAYTDIYPSVTIAEGTPGNLPPASEAPMQPAVNYGTVISQQPGKTAKK
jgi:hypothetical protein